MPQFKKLTPNLVVASIERSLAFYVDVLGFAPGFHVPDAPPYVFASVTGGGVEIFLNDRAEVAKEHPEVAAGPLGGFGNGMFIEVEDIDALWSSLQSKVPVLMPLVTQWYGMKEFTFADPDSHVITFAERA